VSFGVVGAQSGVLQLFDRDDQVSKLRLLSSAATNPGVIIAAYQPA
jgi:hypothetical protein